MLSIIIPTLNAQSTLAATIDCLESFSNSGPLDTEVIIADGGSIDGTRALADAMNVRSIRSVQGRGPQLAAGATAAKGDWLLFLHADTRLADGWTREVSQFIKDPDNLKRAAVFRFALDDLSASARRLETMVRLRCRTMSLPYGDQGLLLSRSFYQELGGFDPLPLFEDVDIVRRIGRRRLTQLKTNAVTSAARYRRDGYILRPLRNLTCLSLYFAGISPRLIGQLYR